MAMALVGTPTWNERVTAVSFLLPVSGENTESLSSAVSRQVQSPLASEARVQDANIPPDTEPESVDHAYVQVPALLPVFGVSIQ